VAIPTDRISSAAAAMVIPAICAIVRETFLIVMMPRAGDSVGCMVNDFGDLAVDKAVIVDDNCAESLALLELELVVVLVAAGAVTMIVLCVAATALFRPEHVEYSDVPFDFVDCGQSEE